MFAKLSMNYSVDRSQLRAVIYGVRRSVLQGRKSRLGSFLSAMIGVPGERGESRRGTTTFGECSGYIPEITAVWLECGLGIVYAPLHSNRIYVNSRTHRGRRKIL